MKVDIKNLMDDAQCYDTVRELRWPEGRQCPFCDSRGVIRRGFDEKQPARQRYECKDCRKRFDDLTGTVFSGHHQPLKSNNTFQHQKMAKPALFFTSVTPQSQNHNI